ncbi:hypothetical protein MRX96_024105 [Rhipicephalus microplus]
MSASWGRGAQKSAASTLRDHTTRAGNRAVSYESDPPGLVPALVWRLARPGARRRDRREGGQRHGGVSGSRPPAVMGLRFRRLRRMSSGEDVVTASSPSSGAQPLPPQQPQQQPGGSTHPPNNGSSEEEEACDGLAELSRPVRPLPIKDGYLHVLSGDRVWFRLYVALHAGEAGRLLRAVGQGTRNIGQPGRLRSGHAGQGHRFGSRRGLLPHTAYQEGE